MKPIYTYICCYYFFCLNVFFITHINLKNTIINVYFLHELKALHVIDTRILNGGSQKPALNVLPDFPYAL